MPAKTLTKRQQAFAQAVAVGKSYADAARIAYGDHLRDHPSTGHRLAQKPLVKQAIARAQSSYLAARDVSIEWWRHEAFATYNRAIARGDLPSQIASLKLLGQHLGALEPRDPVSPETARIYEMLGRVIVGRSVSHDVPEASLQDGARAEDTHASAHEDG